MRESAPAGGDRERRAGRSEPAAQADRTGPDRNRGRPRVCIITRSIDRSGTSGSGHHLREMIKHLVPAAPDLDIVLAHYDPDARDEVYDLAPSIVLPVNPLRAARVLNAAGAEVVHFSPLTIVSPINGLRAKTVATIHSAEPMLLPDQYSFVKRLHSRYVISAYARRLDALVTVSETSKRFFAEHYRVPEDRIAVTYNACAPAYRRMDASEFTPGGAVGGAYGAASRAGHVDAATGPRPSHGARGESGAGENPSGGEGWPFPARYVLHVSRFSERKNPWTMIEAFSRLVREGGNTASGGAGGGANSRCDCSDGAAKSSDPGAVDERSGPVNSADNELYLVLAGKGWDAPEVRRRAAEAGIGDRVVTPGFVAEETVVELLNRAQLFWFPSLSEGFGMPNVEAMACGCPVVTSAVFAVPEIVGDAAVVLEDPRDARRLSAVTAKLLRAEPTAEDVVVGRVEPARDGAPALPSREQLVERGFVRARYFSWETSAAILANVYRRILGMSTNGPKRYRTH